MEDGAPSQTSAERSLQFSPPDEPTAPDETSGDAHDRADGGSAAYPSLAQGEDGQWGWRAAGGAEQQRLWDPTHVPKPSAR